MGILFRLTGSADIYFDREQAVLVRFLYDGSKWLVIKSEI